MPNWCENLLTVSGPIEDVQKFKLDGYLDDEQIISAEKFLPICVPPKHILSRLFEEINDSSVVPSQGWLAWRNTACETNWNLCDFSTTKDEWFKSDTNSIRFLTAYNPPARMFDFIAKQYPTISFKLAYFEPGLHEFGYLGWKAGGEAVLFCQDRCTRKFLAEHMGYSPAEIDKMFSCVDEDVTA